MNMIKILAVASSITLLLSGCVSMTEPVSMGNDKYMITLNARGGFSNDGELLAQTITRANEFCASKNLVAEILETEQSGVQMWTPQNNQVIFRCVEPTPPFKQHPDT